MKPTAGTVARTIILGLAILNQVLTWCGLDIIEIPNETINTLVDGLFLIGAAVAAWWKNNSFTKAALEADEYMKEIRVIDKGIAE